MVHYEQFKINPLLSKLPLCIELLEEEITCCPREGRRQRVWIQVATCWSVHLKDTHGNNVVDGDSVGKNLQVRNPGRDHFKLKSAF